MTISPWGACRKTTLSESGTRTSRFGNDSITRHGEDNGITLLPFALDACPRARATCPECEPVFVTRGRDDGSRGALPLTSKFTKQERITSHLKRCVSLAAFVAAMLLGSLGHAAPGDPFDGGGGLFDYPLGIAVD